MSDIPYSVRGGRATTSVAGLTDTTITNLLNQQILKYDSASQKWINAVDGGGDATISSLGDTLISNPLTNQSLVYNATISPARWENQVTPFTQSDFTNAVSTDAAFINHKPIISTTSSSTMVGINTGVNKEGDLTAFGKGAGDSAKSGHICIGQISGNLGASRAISLGYNTHSTHNNSVVIHGGVGMGSSATNAFYIDPLRSLDALTQTVGNMKINMYNTSTKEIFLTDNLLVPGKTKLNGSLEVSNGLGSVNQVLTSNNTGALTWTDKSQLSANIYDLGGLTWSGVSDNELIRRTSSTTADGTGISITDINNLTDNKKTLSFFNRVSSLIVPLGLIDYSYNISSTVYKTHLSPKSSHATTSNGLFLQATSTVDPVKVGINVSSPSQALQVGTTLYVNDSSKKVGIGITTPTAQLEVDGSIQIDSAVEARLKFHYSGASAHALSEITAERDPVGGNGGDLHFYTKVDGGNVTEKLRINNIGAIGLGATPDYGTAGQFLKTGGSGSSVSWDTPTNTTYTAAAAGTGLSLTGTVFQNTKPDLTVALTGTGGTTITSSAYPNFTINSTDTNTTYTNGTGVSISASNVISIGQMVGTFDSPSFNTLTLGNGGANLGVINLRDTTDIGIASIAQIRGILDGSNGGQLEFYTKIDGGGVQTRKMAITQNGTLLLDGDTVGSATIKLTSADRTSQQGYIYNSTVSGTKDLSIDSYSAVTSKGIRFQTQGVQRMRIGANGELGFGATNDTGSPTQVLQSNGSTLPPSWVNPSTGGTPIYANSTIYQAFGPGYLQLTAWSSQVSVGITSSGANLFTTPTPGWYQLSFSLDQRAAGAANNFRFSYIYILRNSTIVHEIVDNDPMSELEDARTKGGGFLVQMGVNDIITFRTNVNSGSYGVAGMASFVKVS